jgi:SAM-dependent methyltransferase
VSPRISDPEAGPAGAHLVADRDRPGAWTLLVDGTPQSHVDTTDPTYLEFEYVRWLARYVDAAAPAGRRLGVLHLGGGAWTLARYVAATRPGSRQRVVELDGALVRLVRDRLPPAGPGVRVREGDAREVVTGLRPASADLVVVDAFAGARIPAHLTSLEFVAAAARVVRPGGGYAANLADGAPLAFARRQVATVAAVFGEVALVAEPHVLRGRRFGNLVLLGAHRPGTLPVATLSRRLAGEPFAVRVVAGEDLTRFVAGARPVADADAEPSPEPPPEWLRG